MVDTVILQEPFKNAWQGRDVFACVEGLTGQVYRQFANRKTLRFEFGSQAYFVKIHRGIGLLETLKNFMLGNRPVWGAEQEKTAIDKLNALQIPTLSVVGFGKKGFIPWLQHSFLITRALENTMSLEELCESWNTTPPSFKFKRYLIESLATMTRCLHKNGVNHRDYYLCHFLINKDNIEVGATLSVIDLHRAQCRHRTPLRWIVKDVGGLYFSAMHIGLSKKDLYRFIRIYANTSLRKALADHDFWRAVVARASELYEKQFDCRPANTL